MHADSPINRQDEDLLNRSSFALHLAEMLRDAPTDHSVVFGVSGAWGSGKTSVLNIACEALEKSGSELLVVRFNPWNYLREVDLVSALLRLLSSEIRNVNWSEKLKRNAKKFVEAICDYSEALDIAGFKRIQSFLKVRRKRQKELEDCKTPEQIKGEIVEILRELGIRIVVVIDDIDRLSDEKVCQVFQLVAAIADFPRVNYVLAYDQSNVIHALNNVQRCDGALYLEKIIQVPIELPILNEGLASNILLKQLNAILLDDGLSTRERDGLIEVAGFLLRQASTVRDIYRVMNVFEIEWSTSKGKIAPNDLLGMSIVKVYCPGLLSWVNSHLAELAGGCRGGYDVAEAKKAKDTYRIELGGVAEGTKCSAQDMLQLLCFLFPKLANACGVRAETISDAKLKLSRRISSSEILEAYLKGSIESYAFPRDEIKKLMSEGTADELRSFLERDVEGSGITLVSAAMESLEVISGAQKENIARSLIRSNFEDVGFASELLSPASLVDGCLKSIFASVGLKIASEIYEAECLYLDARGFARIATFFNGQELAYGRLAAKGVESGNKLISLECLQAVELLFVCALENEKLTSGLLTFRGSRMLLYLWKSLAPELYRSQIDNGLFNDALAYALFASQHLNQYHSVGGFGWAIRDGCLEEINLKKLHECCVELPSIHTFWELDEETQLRVVALRIMVAKLMNTASNSDGLEVLTSDASNELQRWKAALLN